jgi:hypothetical protein
MPEYADTIREYATPADFAKWRALAETLDTGSLRYTIADCRAAAANMRGWNPIREGYYEDQAFTYADELSRRSR